MRHSQTTPPAEDRQAPPRLCYSVSEAARTCGLSRSTIYALMVEGKLAYKKCGARRLVPVGALEAFLESLPGAA
jgi:excisionase family DNA binding protein